MKVNSFGVGLRQFAPPLFAKRKEKLHVLFIPLSYPEVTPETFFARAEENLRDSFYSYRGGVVGALKRAIASTGYLLHSRQVRGAIFCLAEGKEETYMALSGPLTAILRQQGKVRSITGSHPAPGESPEPKPVFFSFPLKSGTLLLLLPVVDEPTLRHLEKASGAGKGEEILTSIQETLGPRSWAVAMEPEAAPTPSAAKPLVEKLKTFGRQAWDILAPAKKPPPKPAPSHDQWAKTLALIIPMIVLFLVLLAYFQRAKIVNDKVSQLLRAASTAISVANSTPDESAQREALKAAARAIEEARLLRPLDPRIQEMERTFWEQYDKTYKIVRNFPVFTLIRFASEAKPRNLIVDGRDIYILDSGTDKLYLYHLNEIGDALTNPDKPTVLLQRGQAVEDTVVGELMGMAFYFTPQPETEKGILILDSSFNLYRIAFPWGAMRHIRLAPGFSYPDRMKTLDKRLYIMDRSGGQIWRYIPGEGGYPSPPTPYFPQAINMEEVRDFALDGYVYLLLADGRLLKFLGGAQVPFNLEPLDKPLMNPSTIFTFPEEDLEKPKYPLYVADSAHSRIVELDKGGKLIRQFIIGEGKPLEIVDFCVVEGKKVAFVLTSESLLLFFFP